MAEGSASTTVVVDGAALERQCAAMLEASGVPPAEAAMTAAVFAQAELVGEPSHGVRLLLVVLDRIAAGGDKAVADIEVVRDRGAIAVWDARRSLGQVTATRAMDTAIGKARAAGIGMVAVRDGNSLTSAKFYALRAAEAGCIGLVHTNASRKVMPPPGGRTAVMGNNPVAVAAPAGRHGVFVLDMACTAVAIERIVAARDAGETIPRGWALDAAGNETTDPAAALDAMALLPFGGYKAFGLALVNEMLTSVLAGGAVFAGESTGFRPLDGPMNTSFTLSAIDIAAFDDPAAFAGRMEAMIDGLKASEPREPGAEILFPGERALRERDRRRAEGVPLAAATADGLAERARRLGVPVLAPAGA